jgi:hypothetical protein
LCSSHAGKFRLVAQPTGVLGQVVPQVHACGSMVVVDQEFCGCLVIVGARARECCDRCAGLWVRRCLPYLPARFSAPSTARAQQSSNPPICCCVPYSTQGLLCAVRQLFARFPASSFAAAAAAAPLGSPTYVLHDVRLMQLVLSSILRCAGAPTVRTLPCCCCCCCSPVLSENWGNNLTLLQQHQPCCVQVRQLFERFPAASSAAAADARFEFFRAAIWPYSSHSTVHFECFDVCRCGSCLSASLRLHLLLLLLCCTVPVLSHI